jgi:hypothetical protein
LKFEFFPLILFVPLPLTVVFADLGSARKSVLETLEDSGSEHQFGSEHSQAFSAHVVAISLGLNSINTGGIGSHTLKPKSRCCLSVFACKRASTHAKPCAFV